MSNKKQLAIIFGGPSPEHEISLLSAANVISSLNKNKYDLLLIAITKNGDWLFAEDAVNYLQDNKVAGLKNSEHLSNYKIDLVLPIVHGQFGEDGSLQSILDNMNYKYLFSSTMSSRVAMDKILTKTLVKKIGITVADSIELNYEDEYDINNIIRALGLSLIVKPANQGSSIGMTVVKNIDDLVAGIEIAFSHDSRIIIEKYIEGRELTVPVIGNKIVRALPVIEIIPKVASWFDYDAKYKEAGSDEICPADLGDKIADFVQEQAVQIYKQIGCHDMARVDFIWDEKNKKLYFLEINTIPGLTKMSLVPKAVRAVGMSFPEFLDLLIKEKLNE